MTGAIALLAAWVGFACLAYAAKGEGGTTYGKGGAKGGKNGKIAPGPIIGNMLKGTWPYGATGASTSTSAGKSKQKETKV